MPQLDDTAVFMIMYDGSTGICDPNLRGERGR